MIANPELGFCRTCGRQLVARESYGRQRPFCEVCQRPVFDDPKLAVAVIIRIGERILLQQRAIEPGLGRWSFPSGFVDRGEVVEAAAVREVMEEVRLPVRIQRLVGLYSRPGHPVVLAVYAAEADHDAFSVGDEVAAVDLFEVDDLPPLAFEHDASIIQDYLAGLPRDELLRP
jgi:ADP-ribose pyrophosphatase YjhB (NUDIX family)